MEVKATERSQGPTTELVTIASNTTDAETEIHLMGARMYMKSIITQGKKLTIW